MAITFAVRGSSFDAYYSAGFNDGIPSDAALITIGANAGALSGSLYDMTSATAKYVAWNGQANAGESRAFSALMRLKANYTNSPTGDRALFGFGASRNGLGPFLEFWHSSGGNITVHGRNEANGGTFSVASFGSWQPTSGTYYDLVFTWDGTTTSNAAKFYVDGTLLGQITAAAALASSWKSSYFNPILVGAVHDVYVNNFYLDEFVIWNSVIDPTSVGLVSGTGSLNGASRTSLVSVSNIELINHEAVSASELKTGVSKIQAGVTVNGTYDGSDRWTDPGESNVANGVAYKANSTTNNKTGTLSPTDVVPVNEVINRLIPFL